MKSALGGTNFTTQLLIDSCCHLSVVSKHGVTFTRASKLVRAGCTGAVPRQGLLAFQRRERVHRQNVPDDWEPRLLVKHHLPATPHCTQFALYLSMPATFGYMCPSAAACGAALRVCSLFPADCTAATTATLLFGVQSSESCFTGQLVERRPVVFGSGLLTAISIIDY